MPPSPMVVDFLSRRRAPRLLAGFVIAIGVLGTGFRVATPGALAAGGPETRIDLGGGVGMEFVRIEPGSFQQGSREGDPQGGKDEIPRTVTLTRSFYLGKFPVTRGQFARFVSEAHYRTEAEAGPSGGFGWDGAKLTQRADFNWKNPGFPQTDAHPVTLVTYNDAQAFLKWLSRKAGHAFVLPSEAQWEYACRAGSTTAYANGNEAARVADIAWFRANAGMSTHPVGDKPLNAWNLGDLPGNVWQWCEDWYAPYSDGTVQDPLQKQPNLSDKPRRVLRGGSWLRPASDLRSAARYRNDPASRNADNGFRVMSFDDLTAAPAAAAASAPPKPAPLVESPGRVESDHIEPIFPAGMEAAAVSSHLPVPHHDVMHLLLKTVIIGAFFLVILVVLIAIVRALTRGGGTSVSPGNMASTSSGPVRTRVVDDGFWIESPGLPAGSVVDCRYVVNGNPMDSAVTFQGASGGQFVFTGSRPSSVSIVVRPMGGISGSPLGRAGGLMSDYLPASSPPILPDPEPPHFRNHPPAY